MERYPILEIDLGQLEKNVRAVTEVCAAHGVAVTGVMKGFWSRPEMVTAAINGGLKSLASSRLSQLRLIREMGVELPLMLIRIPQLCELEELPEVAQYSLQSEVATVEALNEVCVRKGLTHRVVLMFDLGDLREGFWDREEGIALAVRIDKEMEGLELAGIGTNLGCYGSVRPTKENLEELVGIARKIELLVGHRLEIVSGGATTSLGLFEEGNMPEGINHLRVGSELTVAEDVPVFDGVWFPDYTKNIYTLKAQVIEVKTKASHPRGTLFRDAFGHLPKYTDRGDRKRALLALGKADMADPFSVVPRLKGIEILGSSSDHTILDVEDCEKEIKVGDVIEFDPNYSAQLYLTLAPDVNIVFK